MKHLTARTLASALVIPLALTACGGSSKPAEDASSKKEDAAAPADKPEASAASEKKAEKAEKKEEKANDTGMPAVVRKPKDYLTAPDIVYKFNFKESDMGVKADKECYEKSKGDGKKMADCMSAAQKRQPVDDYHFKQDDTGNWYLLAMRTKGSAI